MKAAGLTHGGFYGNFESKDDLILQACSRALEESLTVLRGAVDAGGKDVLGNIASVYLSPTHRDHPGSGCALAALGAEVARNSAPVRSVFTQTIRAAAELLARIVSTKSKRLKRERALAINSSLVGALILSRAVDDPELSTEILQATMDSLPLLNPS
jgi:TetR/AcrR family transcriptional repressor of nem operon